MDSDQESVLVKLTRMEGKLDLSNLRHDQHDAKFATIDSRLNSQSERIGGLEKREVGRDGERKGLALGGRVLWALCGAIPIGVGAAVLRMLGA
ncbi:MAG: hypothetical protein V4696_10410 [Pseudomonadota bacterium]